ncbi:hypothetical protein [Streptomyces sp. V4I2]|uniref:hypothetical protein n=1 Tax=Streptomyces sp. V4I2 TaxID=3042280 RepID=UPI00277D5E4B|nr:hypothetical protein [Streptomyces sp. V4I2]MDQ1047958.1 hypothetical protein [Streptomyces sp. V4I2]
MRWWGKQRSVAAGGDIEVAVTGDHNRVLLAPRVRSSYWEQVRRISPPELVGRERELADLAVFCTAESGPAYAWWRAEAWAGKTALMSWFALHPPPGVRIVPFFVTARLGAQNDVVAYVDVVLEQLAELAGESLPAHLTESTREAHLLYLYGAAAHACEQRGERLVLLVDGLDEDRGVTTGPEAHSIASLLPAHPRAGTRVLVAGRLNPPLPGDVPADHPLRDPGIVRTLPHSPYAEAIRTEAERELKELIEAGGLEYDLLALVTAAGGGLTAEDLAALTGAVPYRVRDVLRTRAGRTFGVRVRVYLLGHEELQSQAEQMLGGPELDRYRAKLHSWAEQWRECGWPPDTPEYLLRGYFRLVRAAEDAGRLVELAVDEARHDRMLEVTGSDAAALTEIRNAGERVAQDASADLLWLLRLAVRRTRLRDRNTRISATLCRAWAELGQPEKAVALAHAVPYSHLRVRALAEVARVLLTGGEHRQALAALADAETQLYGTNLQDGPEALAAVLEALVACGPQARHRADRLADRIAEEVRDNETYLVVDVVGFWADTARAAQAEELARSETSGSRRATALARVALALAGTGEHARADALFDEVRRLVIAEETASPVARMLSRAGAFARAEALVDAALAERPKDPNLLRLMVTLCAGKGELGRAEAWAGRIDNEWLRRDAEAELARALVRDGRIAEAQACAARIPASSGARTEVAVAVVEALAATGRYDEAEAAAAGLASPWAATDALIRGAVVHAKAGHVQAATSLIARLETTMRDEIPTGHQAWELTEVAEDLWDAGYASAARAVLDGVERVLPPRPAADASDKDRLAYDSVTARVAEGLATVGELRRAEALLLTTFEPYQCEEAWRAILRGLAEAARYGDAKVLMSLVAPDRQLVDLLRAETAWKLAEAGRTAKASEIAQDIEGPHLRTAAFAAVAEAMAVTGDQEQALELLHELQQAMDVRPRDVASDVVLASTRLYRAWRAAGDDDSARAALRTAVDIVTDGRDAPEGVIAALVDTGWDDYAEELVEQLPEEAMDTLIACLAAAGRHTRAARLARLDDDPLRVGPSAAVALAPVVAPAVGCELAVRLLLGEGSWLDALPAVVRLEARSVSWVVEALRDPTAARTSAPSWS